MTCLPVGWSRPSPLPVKFIQHCLHLTLSMAVVAPRRATDPGLQPIDCLDRPPCVYQGLRRHKIARRVVRIDRQQRSELLQRLLGFAAAGQFHRHPVARKTVLWVQGQNLPKSCNLVQAAHILPSQSGCTFCGDCRNWYLKPQTEGPIYPARPKFDFTWTELVWFVEACDKHKGARSQWVQPIHPPSIPLPAPSPAPSRK